MSLECGFFDSTEIIEVIGGYPRGDKAQDAEFFAEFFSDIIGNGVRPSPSSTFQVLPQSGMQVQMRPGKCYIHGHMAWDKEVETLTVTAGTTVYVVFRFNAASEDITRLLSESVQRSGSIYDLAVARITVPAGAVEVTDDMIEDLRSDPDYCGYVQKITDEAATEMREDIGQIQAELSQKMDTPTLTSATVTTLNQATGTITWYQYGKLAVASLDVRITTTNSGNSVLMAAAQYPLDKMPLYLCRQNGMDGQNNEYSITLSTDGTLNIRNKRADAACTLDIMYLLAD